MSLSVIARYKLSIKDALLDLVNLSIYVTCETGKKATQDSATAIVIAVG